MIGDGSRQHPVGIAVVGLGYWGPNLVRNLNELPGAEASRSATCAQALAKIGRRYPAVETTTSFEDVLGDDRRRRRRDRHPGHHATTSSPRPR